MVERDRENTHGSLLMLNVNDISVICDCVPRHFKLQVEVM